MKNLSVLIFCHFSIGCQQARLIVSEIELLLVQNLFRWQNKELPRRFYLSVFRSRQDSNAVVPIDSYRVALYRPFSRNYQA